MDAPGSFIFIAIALAMIFGVCMAIGGLWLFFGWYKRTRWLLLLSLLPLGVGCFLVLPLILLSCLLFILWLVAAIFGGGR